MSSVTSSTLFYPDHIYQPTPVLNQINSGRQMIQIIREAEKKGYTTDDLETALQFNSNAPLEWLEENWKNLCEVVMTMSNNQIFELEQSNGNKITNFPMITEKDAKASLRLCKGNVWQSVEKCVQRYQDNKAFGSSESAKTFTKQPSPSKSKSFTMQISGHGTGKANNDANCLSNTDNEYDELIDNENLNSKLEVNSGLKESANKTDLLNFYLKKINDSKDMDKLTCSKLEALIQSWQQEKQLIDYEREQLKLMEKNKQNMLKLIDVQKRIGGYSSDGTTTEEELDREVARVFQNQLSDIESDQTPTFTNNGDILDLLPGPSGLQSKLNNDDYNQV